MVGSAVVRRLTSEPVAEILTVSRDQLDLREQSAVRSWMQAEKPDVVVLAAARVGGIAANDRYPANFLSENLLIQSNIIDTAAQMGIAKLIFLGSSCIYPRFAPQPIAEESLLTGPLEPTNQWYAIAKIAGLKLCEAWRKQKGCDFISAMPTNLYGPGDNYDLNTSHVLPALIRKAHEAKETRSDVLTVWGTGTPRREFMHVDDLADALIFLLKSYSDDAHINVGTGTDVTISEAAQTVADVVGFNGRLVFDQGKPDGTPRKLMDGRRMAELGWQARIDLKSGLAHAYRAFLATSV